MSEPETWVNPATLKLVTLAEADENGSVTVSQDQIRQLLKAAGFRQTTPFFVEFDIETYLARGRA